MASCRACGGELEPITECSACEEDVQWKCVSCNKETDFSIHTHDGKIILPADSPASGAVTSVATAA